MILGKAVVFVSAEESSQDRGQHREAQHSVQSKKLALTGKPAASVPLAASLTREIQASVVQHGRKSSSCGERLNIAILAVWTHCPVKVLQASNAGRKRRLRFHPSTCKTLAPDGKKSAQANTFNLSANSDQLRDCSSADQFAMWQMWFRVFALLAVGSLSSSLEEALDFDDECTSGACALNALQKKSEKSEAPYVPGLDPQRLLSEDPAVPSGREFMCGGKHENMWLDRYFKNQESSQGLGLTFWLRLAISLTP
eukprot:Skav222094  [mRNA]  locus=scaffold2165:248446:252576:- [translate_table: standard]